MKFSQDPPALPPRHAGECYPNDPERLLSDWERHIDLYVQSKTIIPESTSLAPVLIVPHIDFRVNLDLYVESYARLYTAEFFPELVIILGVGHQCPHEFSVHPYGLETPLSTIPPDLPAWNQLQSLCPFPLSNAPESFDGEHSLEFAAVWLDVIRELAFPDHSFKVLPVLCGGLFENLYLNVVPDEHDDFFLLGKALRSVVESRPPNSTLIIASIDGCHVGPRFQHPFGAHTAVQRAVAHWESDLWSKAQPDTHQEFFEHLALLNNMFHFDGVGVLSLLLQHFPYRTRLQKTECWHEDSDQSLVTFSSGVMHPS
jgi:hypothetical protein